MEDEDLYYSINYTIDCALEDDDQDNLTTIMGQIVAINELDDDPHVVGSIIAYKLDVENAIDRGENLHRDLFDLDGATEPFYALLYDRETDEYKEEIEDMWGDCHTNGDNILIIDNVDIKSDFKGKEDSDWTKCSKIEIMAIYRTIQRFRHGCSLVAIELPMYSPEGHEPELLSRMEELRWYCSLIGFKATYSRHFMLYNTIEVHPKLDQILAVLEKNQ